MVDSRPFRRQRRRSRPDVASAPSSELEREGAFGRLHADRPRPPWTATSPPALTSAGPAARATGPRVQPRSPCRCPRSRAGPRRQLDPRARRRERSRRRGADDHGRPVLRNLLERRSYPAETTASWTVGRNGRRSLPGLERERDDLPQLGPGLKRARLVQTRELRLRRKRERIASSRWNSSSAAASASPASSASTRSSMSVPIARNRRDSITMSL